MASRRRKTPRQTQSTRPTDTDCRRGKRPARDTNENLNWLRPHCPNAPGDMPQLHGSGRKSFERRKLWGALFQGGHFLHGFSKIWLIFFV